MPVKKTIRKAKSANKTRVKPAKPKSVKKPAKKQVKKPAAKKKSAAKPIKKQTKNTGTNAVKSGRKIKQPQLIGKITHYFSKLNVAVIKLSKPLAKGDSIRIIGGENDFEQKAVSMEINGKRIEKAKTKDDFGLKVRHKVREGYKVYKV